MTELGCSRLDQLIASSNRMLKPSVLHSLSINEILVQRKDVSPLNHQTIQLNGFGSLQKYLETYDAAPFENDDAGKWTCARYLALRAMIDECDRTKKTALHGACVSKVLEWFRVSGEEQQQATVAQSLGRISPVKSRHQTTQNNLDRDEKPQETSNIPSQLERFKQRDLRTSHIHRIANLRERGFTITSPRDQHSIAMDAKECNQSEGNEPIDRIKLGYHYHTPETEAEHELNQLWLQKREEEAATKAKHDEVHSALHKWSRGRSREEAEFLRKQESTRMMAHKQNANLPLNISTAKETNQEELYALNTNPSSVKTKQPTTPIIIKKKHSATGMRYRNPLPPNYKPSPTISVEEKTPIPPSLSSTKSASFSKSNSGIALNSPFNEPKAAVPVTANNEVKAAIPVTATEGLTEPSTRDERSNYIRFTASYTSLVAPDAKQNQLQRLAAKRRSKKSEVRGTVPQYFEATSDLELRLFQEVAVERKCQTGRLQNDGGSISQPKLVHAPSTSDVRRSSSYSYLAGTSGLRMQQADELEDIRAAFERHNLAYNPAIFERAILIPEDKSAIECAKNLPIAGSKLLDNPLLSTKLKLMKGLDGTKKRGKKSKKTKKAKGKKKKAK